MMSRNDGVEVKVTKIRYKGKTAKEVELDTTMRWINKIAPSHSRTSCKDDTCNNTTYAEDDFGGCRRCDLLTAYKRS